MPTHILTNGWTDGAEILSQTVSNTAELATILDVEVPDSDPDYESVVSLDVSEVKSFHIESDQDILLEVNDGAGAGGSMNLTANVPYQWHVDRPDAFEFGTDWTSLFFTNASGETALVRIRALVDSTPA